MAKESYTIKLDVKQNDFHRYVVHGHYYDYQELNATNIIIKNEFKKQLAFMDGIDTDVKVRILHSDLYNVYVVFDFSSKDVYLKTEYTSQENESWVALLNYSENNTNHINKNSMEQEWFIDNVEKPTKLIVAMYYNDIATFIQESCMQLQKSKQFVDDIISSLKQQQEQNIEKAEKTVDKSETE